ncbi:flavin monoamine oxidase family protein [Roseateles cellulosilyticus]|uniref:FAD-dependent oxidoreductase n=1 Tax=Pelomonas cellulosilytica TaxID=2906762 RepID=A0ABS8Y189_9BURK|nr:FAD-dependent oxidoreductase [Pelomonas sp. P8]MCE4556786.1 FAD-dependent oxidoreductase [Pelomonas sp. P8]
MLDVVIVGGGVSGLALAHSLHARRVNWALFEARDRLGGRVRTVAGENGAALDLGPTWFWPGTQPAVAQLVKDLGLANVEQPDDGTVWLLDDPNRPPGVRSFDPATGQLLEGAPPISGSLHGGARRLVGGMQALVDALAARLPAPRLHLGHVLRRIEDRADHVALHLHSAAQGDIEVEARRVVVTLPPRLLLEQVGIEPVLPEPVREAMQQTPTWMAHAAKAAVPCQGAVWRDQGQMGNAWVTHSQAVLAEVFEAGGAEAPALAGFVALPASERPRFERSLPLLLHSQLAMLYGFELQPLGAHWHDWAQDPFTCSTLDREEDGRAGHPGQGDPALRSLLQRPLWEGRLWLGGSETATHGTGYLEGALRAAGRLRNELAPA